MLPPREAKTTDIKPGAVLTVAKDGKVWYYLCRPDGRKLSRIRADAKVYLGMTLKVVGFLPTPKPPSAIRSRCHPTRTKGPATRWPSISTGPNSPRQTKGTVNAAPQFITKSVRDRTITQLTTPRGRKASAQ